MLHRVLSRSWFVFLSSKDPSFIYPRLPEAHSSTSLPMPWTSLIKTLRCPWKLTTLWQLLCHPQHCTLKHPFSHLTSRGEIPAPLLFFRSRTIVLNPNSWLFTHSVTHLTNTYWETVQCQKPKSNAYSCTLVHAFSIGQHFPWRKNRFLDGQKTNKTKAWFFLYIKHR